MYRNSKENTEKKGYVDSHVQKSEIDCYLTPNRKINYRFKMNIGPETVKLLEENIVGEHLDH